MTTFSWAQLVDDLSVSLDCCCMLSFVFPLVRISVYGMAPMPPPTLSNFHAINFNLDHLVLCLFFFAFCSLPCCILCILIPFGLWFLVPFNHGAPFVPALVMDASVLFCAFLFPFGLWFLVPFNHGAPFVPALVMGASVLFCAFSFPYGSWLLVPFWSRYFIRAIVSLVASVLVVLSCVRTLSLTPFSHISFSFSHVCPLARPLARPFACLLQLIQLYLCTVRIQTAIH